MRNRIPIYLISAVCVWLCLQVFIITGDKKAELDRLEYRQKVWAYSASYMDQQLVQAISRTNIRVSKLEQAPAKVFGPIMQPPGGG